MQQVQVVILVHYGGDYQPVHYAIPVYLADGVTHIEVRLVDSEGSPLSNPPFVVASEVASAPQ